MTTPHTAADDLGTREKLRRSLAALKDVQKTPRGVSVYSRYVNRPLGRRLAAVAYVLDLTPNSVTLLSGLCSFGAVSMIVALPPTVPVGVAISMALLLGFALDSADGQLARLRGTVGPAGEWLDHVLDCAVKLALHGGVLVAWYRWDYSTELLLVAFLFQFVAVLFFFSLMLAGVLLAQLVKAQDAAPAPASRTPLGPIGEVLRLFVDYGILGLSFLLWGWTDVFTVSYVILFVAYVGFFCAFARHWMRELKQAEAH